ncbi:hypothetical protein [Thiosocius teredinicola]|uniref:hypothetical protein n=1 Tax=Thiosocius teredinicola TaxID=1973002 RepID=UPI0009911056
MSSSDLMILPASNKSHIRLVKIPPDYQGQEVYRKVTGLIAEVEEQNPDYTWEDVLAMLEDHGFEAVEFQLGPSLD